jgi:hypothetical protein
VTYLVVGAWRPLFMKGVVYIIEVGIFSVIEARIKGTMRHPNLQSNFEDV